MQEPTSQPGDIRNLPIGMAIMDASGQLVKSNAAAEALGLALGDSLPALFDQSAEQLRLLCRQELATLAQLKRPGLDKPCRISGFLAGAHYGFWVEDLSTVQALSRQAQALQGPERQSRRLIAQHAATGLGLAELLGVILAEDLGLTEARQAALRGYHADLMQALGAIQALADGGVPPARGSAQEASAGACRALVVDADSSLAELLAELLDSHGYKATPLTGFEAATQFCALHQRQLSLALIDESLASREGQTLVAWMQAQHPHIRLLTLTQGQAGEASVQKPVDFNQLLARLQGLPMASGS